MVTQPFLTTDRLWIRDWNPEDDAVQAFEIYGDPEVTTWLGGGSSSTIVAVQKRLQRYVDNYAVTGQDSKTGCWAIVEKSSQEIVGNILLIPLPDRDYKPSSDSEIGWHFRRKSWGQGYATESARAIMDYGLGVLKLSAIHAVTMPDNARSIRVTQRLGMRPLGLTQAYYGGLKLLLFRSP
jgi:RimJ/RimL family protein N-acetyltransferase